MPREHPEWAPRTPYTPNDVGEYCFQNLPGKTLFGSPLWSGWNYASSSRLLHRCCLVEEAEPDMCSRPCSAVLGGWGTGGPAAAFTAPGSPWGCFAPGRRRPGLAEAMRIHSGPPDTTGLSTRFPHPHPRAQAPSRRAAMRVPNALHGGFLALRFLNGDARAYGYRIVADAPSTPRLPTVLSSFNRKSICRTTRPRPWGHRLNGRPPPTSRGPQPGPRGQGGGCQARTWLRMLRGHSRRVGCPALEAPPALRAPGTSLGDEASAPRRLTRPHPWPPLGVSLTAALSPLLTSIEKPPPHNVAM